MYDEEFKPYDSGLQYEAPDKIDPMGIYKSLVKLHLLADDIYLSQQALNLSIIDKFITDLEYEVLDELQETESTPIPSTVFLSAQSQMWIFYAYELLRTWSQRVREIETLYKNEGLKGLKLELKTLREKNDGYTHGGRENRIRQIERIINEPNIVQSVKNQHLHLDIPRIRLKYLRISIAKHEVSNQKNSIARAPGYGRINSWCGSLDYELENGHYSMGYISRRDVADSIRHLDCSQAPPTEAEINAFKKYMSGK